MQIMIWCPVCEDLEWRRQLDSMTVSQVRAEPEPPDSNGMPLLTDIWQVRVGNDNVVPQTCPQGHEFVIRLQAHKYQVLFESAALAFKDGYYRESMASAATAIERAREHYVLMAVGMRSGIEQAKKMWKALGKFSERQYGAFVAVYSDREGEPPPALEKVRIGGKNMIELRNDAVHNGYIPTEQEAQDYLAAALAHLQLLDERLGNPDPIDLIRFQAENPEALHTLGEHASKPYIPLGYPLAARSFWSDPEDDLDIVARIERSYETRKMTRLIPRLTSQGPR